MTNTALWQSHRSDCMSKSPHSQYAQPFSIPLLMGQISPASVSCAAGFPKDSILFSRQIAFYFGTLSFNRACSVSATPYLQHLHQACRPVRQAGRLILRSNPVKTPVVVRRGTVGEFQIAKSADLICRQRQPVHEIRRSLHPVIRARITVEFEGEAAVR